MVIIVQCVNTHIVEGKRVILNWLDFRLSGEPQGNTSSTSEPFIYCGRQTGDIKLVSLQIVWRAAR